MVCQVLPQYDLEDKALAESKVEPCGGTGGEVEGVAEYLVEMKESIF